MLRATVLLSLTLSLLFHGLLIAQEARQSMPRENVVDVPAIGEGLSVSNVFQTNMVLQRDKPNSIWGWADPGENVSVSFGGEEQETTAAQDRSWRVTLPAMKSSSSPRVLTVTGAKKSLTLENILVGDVWILGGQSNMEFPLERIENGQLEIVSANYPNIRILTVPAANGPEYRSGFARLHEWSGWFSRHFRKGDWDVCSPDVVRDLSAIGYVFGRRIHTTTQIPLGIIDVSRGGTTVETWTPDRVLRKIESQHIKSLLADWDARIASWDAQADLDKRIANFNQRVARLKKEGKEIRSNEVVPADLRPGQPWTRTDLATATQA